ncbi:MAG: YraN family protein, partial [Faecalibacterium sp.]|nr:YraN family protein [Faecalibacterium sp.]
MNSRKEGVSGEELAIEYLKKQGLKVVEQNVRMTIGEIDVVCYDGDVLVFVEVKTRSTLAFGDPLEAIDRRKVQKYRKMAEE